MQTRTLRSACGWQVIGKKRLRSKLKESDNRWRENRSHEYSDGTLRPRQTKRTSLSIVRDGRGADSSDCTVVHFSEKSVFIRDLFLRVPSSPFLVLACPAWETVTKSPCLEPRLFYNPRHEQDNQDTDEPCHRGVLWVRHLFFDGSRSIPLRGMHGVSRTNGLCHGCGNDPRGGATHCQRHGLRQNLVRRH